jgi:hypothetical protein
VLPGRGEVAHLISPLLRPDLGWDRSNLAPAHGSKLRRCPECHLNCNWLAAVNPLTPRDPDGRTLPFPAELIPKLQAGLKIPAAAPQPEPPAEHGRVW